MKVQPLWYIRRDTLVSGPFPSKLISRDWMLGRFLATDEASRDQIFWAPLDAVPELRPRIGGIKYRVVGTADAPKDWVRERYAAALRWIDERHQRDRRDPPDANSLVQNRRGTERRLQIENPEWTRLRLLHTDLEARFKLHHERFIGIGLLLLMLLALALYAALKLAPVHPVKVNFPSSNTTCNQAAQAKVDWTRCDKGGIWLEGVNLKSAELYGVRFNATNLSRSNLSYANISGADLSFANLAQAKLIGANLTSADLRFSDLSNADLRYADLRNAKLDGASLLGARLDEATWTDGRTCATISVGDCR